MSTSDKTDTLALTYGALLARLWLAARAVQTGVEKFATTAEIERLTLVDGKPNDYGLMETVTVKAYSLSAYKGIPDGLKATFSDQPMIPGFMLPIYNAVLGPALIILGLTILLGVASRTSLLALGLLYISLTWGLILLGEPGNSGVAWLGTHMLLIIAALALQQHNRFCILKKW
jgi:thiosulfate dehydrogenase (quinone) large subunit